MLTGIGFAAGHPVAANVGAGKKTAKFDITISWRNQIAAPSLCYV
jgi:hypothetical protein